MAMVQLLHAENFFRKADLEKSAMKDMFTAPTELAVYKEKKEKANKYVLKVEFSDVDQSKRGMVTRVYYANANNPDSPRNAVISEVIYHNSVFHVSFLCSGESNRRC